MAKLAEFRVVRTHQGDLVTDEGTKVHLFQEGETRRATPSVVAELVKLGVLIPIEDDEKAEQPHEDKSEGDAPANKAETTKTTKAPAKSKDD